MYGIIRNQFGFSPFVRVMIWPPTKNIEPMVVTKYPTVSLCLDSSAFSWRYSLKSIVSTGLRTWQVLYKFYYWFRIVFSLLSGLRCRSRTSAGCAEGCFLTGF